MPKSTGENWMGTPEVAALLGVTQRPVYKLIDDEGLRAFKFGRVRVRKVEVDCFLESRRIEPGTLGHLYAPAKDDEEDEED